MILLIFFGIILFLSFFIIIVFERIKIGVFFAIVSASLIFISIIGISSFAEQHEILILKDVKITKLDSLINKEDILSEIDDNSSFEIRTTNSAPTELIMCKYLEETYISNDFIRFLLIGLTKGDYNTKYYLYINDSEISDQKQNSSEIR